MSTTTSKIESTTGHNSNGNKIPLLYIGILFILFVASYMFVFDSKLNLNGDNIYYHILGEALAGGQGFSDISTPANTPHNHFPPGYPFIISLFMRLGIKDVVFFDYLNGAFAFAAILLLFKLLLKKGLDKRFVLVVCALIAVNTPIQNYATINMSEVPFMFFSILAIYCYTFFEEKYNLKSPYFWGMIAAVIMAYYIRSTGIVLLIAISIMLLLNKKIIPALIFILLVMGSQYPWMQRSERLGGNSYMKQFMAKDPYQPDLGKAELSDFTARFSENLERYITSEIPGSLFFGKSAIETPEIPGEMWLLGIFILGMLILGVVHLGKKNAVLALVLLGTGALVMLWPTNWKGVRFIVPTVPFIILFFLAGLDFLGKKVLKSNWSPLLLGLLAFFAIKPLNWLHDYNAEPYLPPYAAYFELAEWAGENIPENSIVACRKPEFFYFFSHRKTVKYLQTADADAVMRDLDSNKVNYVVIDQMFSSTMQYLVPAINKNIQRIVQKKVVKNPDTYLLELLPPGTMPVAVPVAP